MNRPTAELERRLSGLLAIGSVTALKLDAPAAPRARVRLDGQVSAWLPWLASRAGADRVWSAPAVGEQVLVACPGGDPATGVILGALFCQDHPAPADAGTVTRLVFDDGCTLDYDRETRELKAVLPAGGTARIEADGGITLAGDVTITGDVNVTGTVAADGDVTAGLISLTTHVHGGVTTGTQSTSPPI